MRLSIESHGDQVTGRKVLTITLVDGEWGSVRSTQQVPFQARGSNTYRYQMAPLNMDAKALLRDDGRIRVSLTLEYRGAPSEAETSPGPAPGTVITTGGAVNQGIKQTVTVVLESGTPLIVAQSADADRRSSRRAGGEGDGAQNREGAGLRAPSSGVRTATCSELPELSDSGPPATHCPLPTVHSPLSTFHVTCELPIDREHVQAYQ